MYYIFVFVFVAASTLVRARPFHLLAQTARLLESPTGAFIALQSQGRSKHIFTRKTPAGKCVLTFKYKMPLPVTAPLRKKELPENPQIFRKLKY